MSILSVKLGWWCEQSRASQVPTIRQTPSQRLLAMDGRRQQRRIRNVPTYPRQAQIHGPPLLLRTVRRPDPRKNADRPQMPHRRSRLSGWTGLHTQKVRQSRPPRSSDTQREHDPATARRPSENALPQGPRLRRRQPHRMDGWETALPGVRTYSKAIKALLSRFA
jgi:hypothetical protein